MVVVMVVVVILFLQDKFQTHPFIQQIFVENKLWAGTWGVQGGEGRERLLKYQINQATLHDTVLRALEVEEVWMVRAQKRRQVRQPGEGMVKGGFLKE